MPPENESPGGAEDALHEVLTDETRQSNISSIFDDIDEKPEKPEKEEKKEKKKAPAQEEETTDEVTEETVGETDPLDFDPDKPAKPETKKDEKKKEVPKEERSIATLRKQLEEQGKARKDLEGRFKKFEEDLEVTRAAAVDVNQLPEVQRFRESVQEDAELVGMHFSDEHRELLTGNIGQYLQQFVTVRKEKDPEKRRVALNKLKESLGKTFSTDDDIDGIRATKDIIDLLAKTEPKLRDLETTVEGIKKKAATRKVTTSDARFDQDTKALDAVLDPLGTVDAEILESAPHSVEAFLHNLVSGDEAEAKKLSDAKAWVKLAFAGVPPLSPEEKAKFESQTDDPETLKQVIDKRNQKYVDARKAAARRLTIAAVVLPKMSGLLSRLAELEARYAGEEKEKDDLDDIGEGDGRREAPDEEFDGRKKQSAVERLVDSIF